MPSKRSPHSVGNSRLWKELFGLVGDRAIVRAQEAIILSADSEPQPDRVIARDRPEEYLSSPIRTGGYLFGGGNCRCDIELRSQQEVIHLC